MTAIRALVVVGLMVMTALVIWTLSDLQDEESSGVAAEKTERTRHVAAAELSEDGIHLQDIKTQAPQPAATVQMTENLEYVPGTVTIAVGQTVLWKNVSEITHTVTADPKLVAEKKNVHLPKGAEPFNSGNVKPGETFSHTFTVPGTYRYFCIPHEAAGMVGVVEVQPGNQQASR